MILHFYSDWYLVLLGGAIGAFLRFAIGRLTMRRWRSEFPLATFGINVSGSILLGLLFACTHSSDYPKQTDWLWPFLGIGVLGAFTTFSTFGVEVVTLLERRKPVMAVIYVVGSALLGVLGAWIGIAWYAGW